MSSDEEIRLRGQILTEYMEAKTALVALETEAMRFSDALSTVADALSNRNFRGEPYATARANFPTPEQIWQLVSDITSTQKKMTAAETKLKNLGVDLK